MAWVPALEVAAALAITFVVLPRILFDAPKSANGVVDRLVMDVIRMAAFVIVLVHVLVPLHLFQWTGLVLVGVATVYVARMRPRGWTVARFASEAERLCQVTLYLVEAISKEGNEVVKARVRRWWRSSVRTRLRVRLPDSAGGLVAIFVAPILLVFLGALAVRLYYPLTHAALANADAYVHLAWLKYLLKAEIFQDGIYPHGMHALLATTGTLSSSSSFDLIRFAGPILNSLFVLLVYVVCVRATRHPGAALAAAAVTGLAGFHGAIGISGLRQLGTLPQEWALFFALAGLLMAIEYVSRPKRDRLLYVAMAGFVVAMLHPLASGLVVVGVGVAGIVGAVRTGRGVTALRMWGAGAAGTIAGYLYLPIARLAGLEIYGGVSNLNPVDDADGASAVTADLIAGLTGSPFRVIAVAGALAGLGYTIARMRRGDRTAAGGVALAGFLVGGAVIEAAGRGLLDGWYATRWSDLLLPLLPIGIGLGLAPLRGLWARRSALVRSGVAVATGLAVVAGVVLVMPPKLLIARDSQIEYEGAARQLGTIMRSNERFLYTVVGPPAWYDRVIGSGYHAHLVDFADRLTIADAHDPSFVIPVPSERVYVLTEKQPFAFGARAKLQGIVARYYDLDSRKELMEDVERWMRIYAEGHEGVTIAYEDADIRIWTIEQSPDPDYSKRFGLMGVRR